ncbi:MAG: alpha/beta fold hydrolase [Pirellulaceae bacterium]|jgi:pimeloyl-ACP methyl ester carboxylesterase|nr:alpha/beta fold hydrolase [Pirellulaceae bacterium]
MNRKTVGGGELSYMDQGNGRPLLLIHGFPFDHTMWREQMHGLADRFRVIAPDLRGFGKSPAVVEPMTMDRYADELAELLDALKVDEPVVYIGLSMGGYIGWQFYHRHRDRVARMVMCDTRAANDSEDAVRQRYDAAERVLIHGVEELVEMMEPKLLSVRTVNDKPDLVEALRAQMMEADPVGVASALRGMAERTDFTPHLKEIERPVLLMCGVDDVITPPSEMETIAAQLPKGEFVSIENAGHLAPLENPAVVNSTIRTWLS